MDSDPSGWPAIRACYSFPPRDSCPIFGTRWANTQISTGYCHGSPLSRYLLRVDRDFVIECLVHATEWMWRCRLLPLRHANTTVYRVRRHLEIRCEFTESRARLPPPVEREGIRGESSRKTTKSRSRVDREEEIPRFPASPPTRRVTSTRQAEVIGLIGDAGPIVEEDKRRQKASTPVRPSAR